MWSYRKAVEFLGKPVDISWDRLVFRTSQVALVVKNLPVNAVDTGDAGSIPRSGRSPGGGQGNPLQYSSLKNSIVRGGWRATVHGVTKSQTRLKQPSMQACTLVFRAWSRWVIDVISHRDGFIGMKATGTWLKGTGTCAPHFMVSVCYWQRTKLSCAQGCSDRGSFSQNWQRKWLFSRRNSCAIARDTWTYGMSHHSMTCSSVTAWVICSRGRCSLKSPTVGAARRIPIIS